MLESVGAAGLRAIQAAVETVTVDDTVTRYCVQLATSTRDHTDVLTGSSPRGSLGLALASRGFAVLRGRDYVLPDDVKDVAVPVLAHRIIWSLAFGVLPIFGKAAYAAGARPVRMIVPFAPGGPTDVIARFIAQKLTEAWGQQVVVDNRGGGNTLIGTDLVAKAGTEAASGARKSAGVGRSGSPTPREMMSAPFSMAAFFFASMAAKR